MATPAMSGVTPCPSRASAIAALMYAVTRSVGVSAELTAATIRSRLRSSIVVIAAPSSASVDG